MLTPTLLHFSPNASYQVCFTPQQNCTKLMVDHIKDAKKSIYVQSYSFTNYPIAKALYKAYKRGVDVKIIFDKSQFDPKHFSQSKYFLKKHIPIWIDNKPRIAHNKVMIIDDTWVETGSFNFTYSAQKYNAENMLWIKDKALAKKYLKNWFYRKSKSVRRKHI
mgnify:CR=1 FL=1